MPLFKKSTATRTEEPPQEDPTGPEHEPPVASEATPQAPDDVIGPLFDGLPADVPADITAYGARPLRGPQIGPIITDPFFGEVADFAPGEKTVPTGMVWKPFEEQTVEEEAVEAPPVEPVIEKPRRGRQRAAVRKVADEFTARTSPALGINPIKDPDPFRRANNPRTRSFDIQDSVEASVASQQDESLLAARQFILDVARMTEWPEDDAGKRHLVRQARHYSHPDVNGGNQDTWDRLHIAIEVTGVLKSRFE